MDNIAKAKNKAKQSKEIQVYIDFSFTQLIDSLL